MLGTALAAAQFLPTIEFISHSVRADLSYQAVSAGLPLSELVTILYPGFFGGSPAYVGIATLVLIALALVLGKPRPVIFFWAGAASVSLLLAFGNNLFAYPAFYLFAPGFDAVRQQERAFLIYSFSAAMLAGYGAVVLAGPLPKLARHPYGRFERGLRVVAIVANRRRASHGQSSDHKQVSLSHPQCLFSHPQCANHDAWPPQAATRAYCCCPADMDRVLDPPGSGRGWDR